MPTPLPTLRILNRAGVAGECKVASGLPCPDVNESVCKERSKDIQDPVLASQVPRGKVQNSPRDDSEAEAVGDGVCIRDQDQGKKCRHSHQWLVPANLCNGGEHQGANQNQGRGGRGARNESDERGCSYREDEQQASDDCGNAGTATGGDASCGLNVAGHGRSTGQRTEDGGRGIGKQYAVEARY